MFAGFLAVFSLLRTPALAYPAILLVGLAYFAVITSLSTVLQQRLDDSNRGRVMALWIMGFGGTVPIGNLIAGPLIEATSVTTVVLGGAVVALGAGRLRRPRTHRVRARRRPRRRARRLSARPPSVDRDVSPRGGSRRGARGRRRGCP